MPTTSANDEYSVAVLGAGTAAESLLRELEGSDHRVVVFEPHLVGGECPFYACIPSKAMLHDRRTGRGWNDAVERRDELVHHRDDEQHADQARELGATIVRAEARLDGPGRVTADGVTYTVDHVVIATGAVPIIPDIEGLDADHESVWTSRDALVATARPDRIIVLGGGVVGSELAFMFASYGAETVLLEEADRQADDLHPRTSELITETLERAGVRVHTGVSPERVELGESAVTVHLADDDSHTGDRLLVAVGRAPDHSALGLDTLGVDSDDVAVGDDGCVEGTSNVWMMGDVAGKGQYTHLANHHASVVANHLAGDGSRRFGDAVLPACMFLDPPQVIVGPPPAELDGDDDVVWAEVEIDEPRSATDEHPAGFLAVAARRSTGCIIAANGIGPRLDEISHALVVAIDGKVSVDTLRKTIQPFPTVGGVLSRVYHQLHDQLA
ncbi:MAG: NAD(P)/FAD-dependent oxidoreductase [Ilumatobacter sp.]|nr:NAD(P)/FAD-dependent oxidoreductase [Ilumatobacter sp.]